jgi:trehalose 6-phosphate phosphatase
MSPVSNDQPILPPPDLLQGASLFLDFDGTLVELAEHPEAVQVASRTVTLLDRLGDMLEGRLALISGRPVAQLRQWLAAPVTIVGSHGIEYDWRDGRAAAVTTPAALEDVRKAMEAWAAQQPGIVVEDKPLGIALHFRQRPGAEQACVALARDLAKRHGLQVQPGKMMIEVRVGGGDKGTALRTLMREPEMAGTRPVFMGDDHTDEPGFAAAAELGGAGVLVGPARATAASYRLDGVGSALEWLEAAAAELA